MNITLKGSFSSYQLSFLGTWIKEHLTDLTIYDRPLYICECKISKTGKYELLIESE